MSQTMGANAISLGRVVTEHLRGRLITLVRWNIKSRRSRDKGAVAAMKKLLGRLVKSHDTDHNARLAWRRIRESEGFEVVRMRVTAQEGERTLAENEVGAESLAEKTASAQAVGVMVRMHFNLDEVNLMWVEMGETWMQITFSGSVAKQLRLSGSRRSVTMMPIISPFATRVIVWIGKEDSIAGFKKWLKARESRETASAPPAGDAAPAPAATSSVSSASATTDSDAAAMLDGEAARAVELRLRTRMAAPNLIPGKSVTDIMVNDGVLHLFYTAPRGFMTSDIFADVIHTWCAHESASDATWATTPKLLFMDNHGSHMASEALKTFQANNFDVVLFPGHSTHLFQPLDLATIGHMRRSFKLVRQLVAQIEATGSTVIAPIAAATTTIVGATRYAFRGKVKSALTLLNEETGEKTVVPRQQLMRGHPRQDHHVVSAGYLGWNIGVMQKPKTMAAGFVRAGLLTPECIESPDAHGKCSRVRILEQAAKARRPYDVQVRHAEAMEKALAAEDCSLAGLSVAERTIILTELAALCVLSSKGMLGNDVSAKRAFTSNKVLCARRLQELIKAGDSAKAEAAQRRDEADLRATRSKVRASARDAERAKLVAARKDDKSSAKRLKRENAVLVEALMAVGQGKAVPAMRLQGLGCLPPEVIAALSKPASSARVDGKAFKSFPRTELAKAARVACTAAAAASRDARRAAKRRRDDGGAHAGEAGASDAGQPDAPAAAPDPEAAMGAADAGSRESDVLVAPDGPASDGDDVPDMEAESDDEAGADLSREEVAAVLGMTASESPAAAPVRRSGRLSAAAV